ncbi:MAG: nucleotide exchange factor GrpE [Deltaproteobacteria bacterium]|jgi:molecular chaperone GrpE|nr:nucleotide exchange factor GrpE [Deltaproteobacteria bacterium]
MLEFLKKISAFLKIKKIRSKKLPDISEGFQPVSNDGHFDQTSPQKLAEKPEQSILENPADLASILRANEQKLLKTLEANSVSLRSALLASRSQLSASLAANLEKFHLTVGNLDLSLKSSLLANWEVFRTSLSSVYSQLTELLTQSSEQVLEALDKVRDYLGPEKLATAGNLTKLLGITGENQIFLTTLDELSQEISVSVSQSAALLTKSLTALESLDEKLTQAGRRERRSQQALEYLISSQEEILKSMQSEEKLPSAKLLDFCDNFFMWLNKSVKIQATEILAHKMESFLEELGLKIINETDVPFDSQIHCSCHQESDYDYPDGAVLDIIQPGYYFQDKVLRFAMVTVNRLLEEDDSEDFEEDEDSEDFIKDSEDFEDNEDSMDLNGDEDNEADDSGDFDEDEYTEIADPAELTDRMAAAESTLTSIDPLKFLQCRLPFKNIKSSIRSKSSRRQRTFKPAGKVTKRLSGRKAKIDRKPKISRKTKKLFRRFYVPFLLQNPESQPWIIQRKGPRGLCPAGPALSSGTFSGQIPQNSISLR